MRAVKTETLRLVETFVEKTTEPQLVAQNFVPPLLDPVLGDYQRAIPDARDAEVLSLFATIVNKLQVRGVNRLFRGVNQVFRDASLRNDRE
jgi:exportin-1